MPSSDSLGDRMKFYESLHAPDRLMPLVPAIARLDGVHFHTFTRGLERPYDLRLSKAMIETTKYLVKETNARIGYTQSDEITLIWLNEDYNSSIYFDGKVYKIVSTLAARCTLFFNQQVRENLPEKLTEEPAFDCRVFTVPNKMEAVNCLIWREQDATRNSVQMAARAYFSHAQCNEKSCSDLQEMLFQGKNINWNDYPSFFKRGTYVQRQITERPYTVEELGRLPEKHNARTNPDLKVARSDYAVVDLPPLTRIANQEDVVFDGAKPLQVQKAELY